MARGCTTQAELSALLYAASLSQALPFLQLRHQLKVETGWFRTRSDLAVDAKQSQCQHARYQEAELLCSRTFSPCKHQMANNIQTPLHSRSVSSPGHNCAL